MENSSITLLYRLARLYGVQTAFYGVRHLRQTTGADSLLAVLRALGAPVASLNDVTPALREKAQAVRRQIIEPVTVAWDGARPVIRLTLPADKAGTTCSGSVELESGESADWTFQPEDLPVIESAEVEGVLYVTRKPTFPKGLPFGYHKLILEAKGKPVETMLISAPRRTYSPPAGENSRAWGAFLPLYALKTKSNWGSGDYSGLGELADWVAGEGGNCAGTLPLLPVFLDKPYEPSPYAPVSRLLWNEFYIDINKIPELSQCREAQALAASFRGEIEGLRQTEQVDYRRIMYLKRRVMEHLSKYLPDAGSARLGELQRFAGENSVVHDYARFRAVTEKQGKTWGSWPERLRDGDLRPGDYDEDVKNYHLYAQWLAGQQVEEVAGKARQKGVRMYFDLPLGVHPDGYDVWRHRDVYGGDVSAGAPPDAVFTGGQNWGFPPLHPEKIRARGYRYVIDYLRHNMQYASMLRIDHVMGLSRLFWIPRGLDAANGVYVRYRPEEVYAILSVESHRHQSVIVGEDLGIVPGYIRPAMARHGLSRMYILYYELAEGAAGTLRRIPRRAVASLNTHDMPPFAAFWEGEDIKENARLGLLDEKGRADEKENRRATRTALEKYLRGNGFLKKAGNGTRAAFKACLAFLSDSEAHTVLLNIEDLWLEIRAQNVPGTGDRFPSWRRKARYSLEEFCRMEEVSDILREVNDLRKKKDKH